VLLAARPALTSEVLPILIDAAGRRRQPVTLPGYHAGRPPRNKGRRYPPDPLASRFPGSLQSPKAELAQWRAQSLICIGNDGATCLRRAFSSNA
jgi:hypothetical protein